jgi:hypothetical protein
VSELPRKIVLNGVEYIRQKMREAKAKEIAENPDHE